MIAFPEERHLSRRYIKDQDVGCYMPTPEEIRARCLQIQAGWSDEEEAFHRGVRKGEETPWQPPKTLPMPARRGAPASID